MWPYFPWNLHLQQSVDSLHAPQACALYPSGAPDLREWVVQRYIGNPLLVGGRKFHLRAYVLCIGGFSRIHPNTHLLVMANLRSLGSSD